MCPRHAVLTGLVGLGLACSGAFAYAAERWSKTTQGMKISIATRTPEQVAGFYAARHLPQAAIQRIREACFITISLRNQRREVVWLELDRWRLRRQDGGRVERYKRAHWDRLWAQLAAPLGSRASFGWSQLPEVRDLQPGEPVGGNLSLRPPGAPFRIELRLPTGADKQGEELVVLTPLIRCPREVTAQ